MLALHIAVLSTFMMTAKIITIFQFILSDVNLAKTKCLITLKNKNGIINYILLDVRL